MRSLTLAYKACIPLSQALIISLPTTSGGHVNQYGQPAMGPVQERDRMVIYSREPEAGRRDELYGSPALVEKKASMLD